MDEPADLDGHGGGDGTRVGDTAVIPTKAEREEHDVSRVLSPLVSILCHGKGTGEASPDTEW